METSEEKGNTCLSIVCLTSEKAFNLEMNKTEITKTMYIYVAHPDLYPEFQMTSVIQENNH